MCLVPSVGKNSGVLVSQHLRGTSLSCGVCYSGPAKDLCPPSLSPCFLFLSAVKLRQNKKKISKPATSSNSNFCSTSRLVSILLMLAQSLIRDQCCSCCKVRFGCCPFNFIQVALHCMFDFTILSVSFGKCNISSFYFSCLQRLMKLPANPFHCCFTW